MARAATAPELALFRAPGQWSRYRAAVYVPNTVYSARINQTFSSLDKVLQFEYDGGSGTLSDVLPDMTVYIGSSAGAWDKGIARLRGIDADTIFIGETSEIRFADNDYITIVDSFELWAKPILISSGVVYMDGGTAYTDQHSNLLPLIRGGSNRVLRKTGATVSASFDFPATIPGSSVSSRSTSAPGASSISGGTTQTPTIQWNSVGWKKVYHTVTAANGKSFFIVRYVFVWDDTNAPEPVEYGSRRGDTEAGGWELSITLYGSANLSQVRDHALVILFAEDHYGTTAQEIGPVSGSENIAFSGWIAGESIRWLSQGGAVSFRAYTAHYFLQKIPAWPDGVELTTGTPSNWTQIKNLTVDLGLVHHFLTWRTTAPRIMDIFPTGDTKLTKEVSSLASDLWSQIREMAFDQLFARPLVNCLNQLYIQVHPQLIPLASRTHPTVITFLEKDLEEGIELERITMDEASIVDLSGVSVNSAGKGTAYFSLSPGHSHSQYGNSIVINRLLLSSQSQANQLAGLYRGWINNPYGPIRLNLAANNRLIDICPLQKCAVSLASGDTIRGVSGSLGLIPLSIEETFDARTGYARQEITFEAETFEDLSTNGDVPGSGNVSIPPVPKLPPLPPLDVLIPVTDPSNQEDEAIPSRVIVHDTTAGLLYTDNFNAEDPLDIQWIAVNAGLTPAQYQSINSIVLDPAGGIYVAFRDDDSTGTVPLFLAYAPSIGSTFTIIEDLTSIRAKHAGVTVALSALFCDKLTGTVGYILIGSSSDARLYIGSGTTFNAGSPITGYAFAAAAFAASLSFGFGKWLITGPTGGFVQAGYWRMSADGTTVEASGVMPITTLYEHLRVSSSDKAYHHSGDGFIYSTGNGAVFSGALSNDINTGLFLENRVATDPSGLLLMGDGLGGAHKAKSSDGGASFSGIPTLPSGNLKYAYAGGAGLESRWVAAAGTIYYSGDFGGSWEDRGWNLNLHNPTPLIDVIKVIGYS